MSQNIDHLIRLLMALLLSGKPVLVLKPSKLCIERVAA